jgi:hypothetical protein
MESKMNLKFKKCLYHNNAKTAVVLMLDDLVPIAVSSNSSIETRNDWGYLEDRIDSLYKYIENYLFKKFPEIKGTIFLPLEEHKSIESNGYTIFSNDFNDSFIKFLKRIESRFEFAFHGIQHTNIENGKVKFEFENYSNSLDIEFANKLINFEKKTGIIFSGGKFPGYRYNYNAIEFIKNLKYKWMALDSHMINKKHDDNSLKYIKNSKLVGIPTNLSGDVFNSLPPRANNVRKFVKKILKKKKLPEELIEYLYLNQLPIIIQEHFQNLRIDGKRQTPNIYDDLISLDKIFGMLRPLDIWYTNCGEIAHYFDSYQNTQLTLNNDGFEINYNGNWDEPIISFESEISKIIDVSSNKTIKGLLKNGKFIYTINKSGKFKVCQ